MNIKDFTEALPYLLEAETTAFIWGHAGIGKSSIVEQYAKSKGYHFFPLLLGTQSDLGDVLGLAEFVDTPNGGKATNFAPPKWMTDTIAYCESNPDSGAIIFLDEFNRARRDILNGMFSLALNKTLHTVKLPKNCHVIAAGNPPTDEYFTTDVDETALMARFVHIKLDPSFDEWVSFAKATGMNDTLIQFYSQQPELLEEKRSDFKLPVKVDRRAVSKLDKLIKLGTPAHLMQDLMLGIIGIERTVAFQQFMKDQDKPLTGSEILSGQRIDLLKKWSNPENVTASLINVTVENLTNEMKSKQENNALLTDAEKENLFAFIYTVPKDISWIFMKDMVTGGNTVFKDFSQYKDYEKTLQKFIRENKVVKTEVKAE